MVRALKVLLGSVRALPPPEKAAVGLALSLPIFLSLARKPQSVDWAIQAKHGQFVIDTLSMADTVQLIHTVVGDHFINGTWLTEVVFAWIYRSGGLPLTIALQALCVSAMVVIPFLHGITYARAPSRALIALLISAPLLIKNTGLRGEMFAFPLFAVCNLVFDRYWDRRNALWIVPVVVSCWTNMHGSFPIVIPLAGVYLADSIMTKDWIKARRISFLLTLALCATCASPYLWGTWEYVALNARRAAIMQMSEWEQPSYNSWLFWRLAGFALVLVAVGMLPTTRASRPRWSRILLATGLALPAFIGVRHAAWWGLALMPFIAERLGQLLPPPTYSNAFRNIYRVITLIPPVIVLGMATTLAVGNESPARKYLADNTPVELAEALRNIRPEGGNLFNGIEHSSYLALTLGGEWPLFVDPRAWIYPESVWAEFLLIARTDEGWEDALLRHNVDTIVADRGPLFEKLVPALDQSSNWQRAYADANGSIYLRTRRPAESGLR